MVKLEEKAYSQLRKISKMEWDQGNLKEQNT